MNTIDLINDARTSADTDSRLYGRAINLLQSVYIQTEDNHEVHFETIVKIRQLLDDSYKQALEDPR